MATCSSVVICIYKILDYATARLASRFGDRGASGVGMQKRRLAGQPDERMVDRRARLDARFVADTGLQEIAAAEAAVLKPVSHGTG